jgi:hypothetical protein
LNIWSRFWQILRGFLRSLTDVLFPVAIWSFVVLLAGQWIQPSKDVFNLVAFAPLLLVLGCFLLGFIGYIVFIVILPGVFFGLRNYAVSIYERSVASAKGLV